MPNRRADSIHVLGELGDNSLISRQIYNDEVGTNANSQKLIKAIVEFVKYYN
jgi:hypothetical protein